MAGRPNPALGTYSQDPSGRNLVRDGPSELGVGSSMGGDLAATEYSVVYSSMDEGSSQWGDSEAQSRFPAGASTFGGTASVGHGTGVGRVVDGSRSGFPGGRVLTDSDLEISEGSVGESGTYDDGEYGSRFGDTAAGGSSVHASAGPRSRVPGVQQDIFGDSLRISNNSSAMSSQSSWRNSPQMFGRSGGGGGGGMASVSSGGGSESTVSPGIQQGGAVSFIRGDSQDDGDFGSVWLANRAHARQYDATQQQHQGRDGSN